MRSRAVVLAAVSAVVVAGVMILVLVTSDQSEAPDVAGPAAVAAPTSVLKIDTAQDPTVEPSTTSPPTTQQASTTTTAPPVPSSTSTTTSPAPVAPTTSSTSPSGYISVAKPGGGQSAIAPGGALTKHLAADIAIAFGFEAEEVEAAIDAVSLPPEASDNPEGWLAPGGYETLDGATALDVVQAMVDRRIEQLEERGIPRDQWYRVLTAASVIEKETYNQNEKPRVARVLTNRLAGGGPLQMDSIILYPVPEDRIFTTSEERSSNQPYNSYRHNGLPPTPICAPDEAAIDAFLAPPPGDWWFYVTIDLHTGETRYAVTYEEHLTNVELLRAWLRENPTD